MESGVPRAWVRLRVRARADRRLAIGVEDHTGRRVNAPAVALPTHGWSVEPLSIDGLGPADVVVPDEAAGWVGELVAELPDTHPPPSADPVHLPVFCVVPPGFADLDWETAIRQVLAVDRVVVVLERSAGAIERFALPLDLVAVGERGSAALAALAGRGSWLGLDSMIQAEAVTERWVEDAAQARTALATAPADVLLLDGWDAAALAGGRLRRDTVRLAVVLAEPTDAAVGLVRNLGFARSVLVLGGPADAEQLAMLTAAFDALAHDLPLHEVAAVAARVAVGPRRVRLVASPESVQDLRLVDAWSGVVVAGHRLAGGVGRGVLDSLGLDIAGYAAGVRSMALFGAPADALREAVSGVADMEIQFTRESRGLHPLAYTSARLVAARELTNRLVAALPTPPAPVGVPPPGAAVLTPEPTRVVNLGLRRVEDLGTGGEHVYVEREASVAAGTRYDLDVQIGAPWADSLIVDEPVPIDLLLPDSRTGHVLDVAVMSTTVEILGPAVQSMALPPAAASPLLSFPVRMPGAEGGAEIRVGVYHGNHLVQTFRITTTVEQRSSVAGEVVTAARLEYSATARWGNLDDLGDRSVSLTLNRTAGGTHTLFAKAGDAAAAVTIDPQAQQDHAVAVRGLLTRVVDDAVDADTALAELAELGYQLHRGVSHQLGGAARDRLHALRRRTDEVVQIVRVHPSYTVPWAAVYDWPLPEVAYGQPRPAVCFGTVEGAACGHGVGDRVVCARGFWGVRHRIEELVGGAGDRDLCSRVPLRAGGLALGIGVQDASTLPLPAELEGLLGAGRVTPLTGADNLIEVLFDAGRRPSVLTVIGHHETGEIVGEPTAERITTGTADGWFIARRIDDEAAVTGDWDAPNTIVLLLACASVAVQPRELTSALASLSAVRAGGVVGTECDVYSDFAARVARDLLEALAGPGARQTFAAAVRAVRARLVLEERDVRGFALAAFGAADTVLVDV